MQILLIVYILCFASCKLFTTAWAWSLLFQFEKHVLKESFFQICVSDMQSLGLTSILLERMNSSPSNEIASWCFSSWSHISLPKLNLYGCFMPPRQTIYHPPFWVEFFTKELHYDFINIFCGYFIFFLILFLCKKKNIIELIKFVFKYISINCMKYCTMYYHKFLSELHLMHVNW